MKNFLDLAVDVTVSSQHLPAAPRAQMQLLALPKPGHTLAPDAFCQVLNVELSVDSEAK